MRGTPHVKKFSLKKVHSSGYVNLTQKKQKPNEAPMENYNNKKKTYQHLNVEEREMILIGLELKKSLMEISKELMRYRSTIWREIRRNNASVYKLEYLE